MEVLVKFLKGPKMEQLHVELEGTFTVSLCYCATAEVAARFLTILKHLLFSFGSTLYKIAVRLRNSRPLSGSKKRSRLNPLKLFTRAKS